jgi:hypothetical protein
VKFMNTHREQIAELFIIKQVVLIVTMGLWRIDRLFQNHLGTRCRCLSVGFTSSCLLRLFDKPRLYLS